MHKLPHRAPAVRYLVDLTSCQLNGIQLASLRSVVDWYLNRRQQRPRRISFPMTSQPTSRLRTCTRISPRMSMPSGSPWAQLQPPVTFVAGPCRASGAVGTDNGFPALSIVPEPCSTSALLALVALAAAVSRRRMNRAWAAAMDCARKGMRANRRQTGAGPRFPSARFPSRRSTNVNPLDDLVRTRNRGRTERSDGLRWVSHAAGAHTGEPANRRQDDEALHR